MAKRMFELLGVKAADGKVLGDVRVRVDMKALAVKLGPKAITATRGRRVVLQGGAVTVEAFNVRTVLPADPNA